MDKNKNDKRQHEIPHKDQTPPNNSDANQGDAQDPAYNEGIADHPPKPGELGKEKEKPKDGNIGKNNAGGYK